jgi:hypothetical protein
MIRNGRYLKCTRLSLLVVVVYIALYTVLSATGTYVSTQSGQIRHVGGIAATDVELWQPRFLHLETRRDINGSFSLEGNLGGYFFSPLICIDQHFVHKPVWLAGTSATGK